MGYFSRCQFVLRWNLMLSTMVSEIMKPKWVFDPKTQKLESDPRLVYPKRHHLEEVC